MSIFISLILSVFPVWLRVFCLGLLAHPRMHLCSQRVALHWVSSRPIFSQQELSLSGIQQTKLRGKTSCIYIYIHRYSHLASSMAYLSSFVIEQGLVNVLTSPNYWRYTIYDIISGTYILEGDVQNPQNGHLPTLLNGNSTGTKQNGSILRIQSWQGNLENRSNRIFITGQKVESWCPQQNEETVENGKDLSTTISA